MPELCIHQLGLGEIVIIAGFVVYFLCKLLPVFLAISILLILLGTLIFRLNDHNNYWHKRGIQGPKGNLLFGSMLDLLRSIHEFDKKQSEKYGKTFGTMMKGAPDLVTEDLDLIKQVVTKYFDAFPDRFNLLTPPKDQENLASAMLSLQEGDDWRRIRHSITPAFTSRKMKKLIGPMHDCSRELVDYLDQFAKTGDDVPLKDAISKLTMNVIGRTVFGMNLNSFDEKEPSRFLHFAKKMFSIKMTDPVVLFIMNFPTVAHLIERWTKKPLFHQDIWDYFETTLSSMMEQRMNEPDAANKYQDALQLMLNAMEDGHTEIGAEDADMVSETVAKNRPKKSLSKVEVMAQLILFLVAGYETTASTLHFVCYILANCPEIQEKLREEVVEVVDGRESIEYEDMTKLEYMNQVISETLRMYPPAVRINRLCQKDVEVDGIHFEKGTCFSFDVYNIHHDPANYPDPEEFDPERFSKENRQARHPMAFLPFGAGPRICLGMRFAEFEMRVALTDLIRNFKFAPTEGMPGLPVKIISQSLLKPAVELKCKVERL